MTGITGIDHFTLVVGDRPAVEHFYCDLLGLAPGFRPSFGVPGVWLYAGDRAIVHLLDWPAAGERPDRDADHIAFTASDLAAVCARLAREAVPFEVRRQPDTRLWQLFCRDPAGTRVELTFPPDDSPVEHPCTAA